MQITKIISHQGAEEFKEVTSEWQRKLNNVSTVLGIWINVQRNWQRLEAIFMTSEGVKAKLPEDTRRFEKIDSDWRKLMIETNSKPSVIEACNLEGRERLLLDFYADIELCEKSLNNYLEEIKNKVFSRFYFVSNLTLLYILSNSNNPEIVNGYIGDYF